MKRFSLVVAAALVACGLASAQITTDTVKVHFEYPVLAAATELPAGAYTIQLSPSSSANTLLTIRSESGKRLMVLANPVTGQRDAPRAGTVVLSRIGNQYRIQQVWITDDFGFELLQ
jgi:hypothetical protein